MRHLQDVGLSYWTHWVRAMKFSLLCASCACKVLVHAFWPRLYPDASKALALWFKENP